MARLMTVDDLRDRWVMEPESDLVMEHVRAGRLKFVDLSAKGVKRSSPGEKTIRFREADVEAFEDAQLRTFDAVPGAAKAQPKPLAVTAPALTGWDGKPRGRGAAR